jgi:CHAD domain-containing protein
MSCHHLRVASDEKPADPAAGSTFLEVERTFVADAMTQPPDLVGGEVAEVREVEEVDLSATYFDTPDLRLVRARITLRRRKGGGDQGWHIKVAAADGARLELHRALTRSARPPLAVRRLVRGVVRDAELVPVAQVDTTRRRLHLLDAEGTVLAELARDDVTARRLLDAQAVRPDDRGGSGSGHAEPAPEQRWHELELELVDGGPAVLQHVTDRFSRAGIAVSASQSKLRTALGDLAPAEPVRPTAKSTAGEVVQAYLQEQWGALLRQDVVLRTAPPDGVHQKRIAARRVRSAVAAYRTLFDPAQARLLEDELRWLGRELSAARDVQVTEALLSAELNDGDAHLAGSTATRRLAHRVMRARHRDASAHVIDLLRSDHYLQMLDEVAAGIAAPMTGRAARPAPRELRRRIRKTHRRVVRRWAAARKAPADERAELLHSARKAAKRLRYACEVAEPALGKRARRLRLRAKALASALGEVQDALVLQQTAVELVSEAAGHRSAGEVSFLLGRLHARLDVQIEHLHADAVTAARRVQSRKVAGWLG